MLCLAASRPTYISTLSNLPTQSRKKGRVPPRADVSWRVRIERGNTEWPRHINTLSGKRQKGDAERVSDDGLMLPAMRPEALCDQRIPSILCSVPRVFHSDPQTLPHDART